MIKPAELIDIRGATALSLGARRLYNKLLANAFGPGLADPGRDFEISLSDLRETQVGNQRVSEYISALMQTIIVTKDADGKTSRVALLGGNDMDTPDRKHGILTYSFDKRLAPLLSDSIVFAKLETAVLQGFTTKYGLALYEVLSRRVRLTHVFQEEFEIEHFRELIGVPPGKLGAYGNLRQKAIEPAVAEIKILAPFSCSVEPSAHSGRKVTHVRLRWWIKSVDELKEVYQPPLIMEDLAVFQPMLELE